MLQSAFDSSIVQMKMDSGRNTYHDYTLKIKTKTKNEVINPMGQVIPVRSYKMSIKGGFVEGNKSNLIGLQFKSF